MISKWIFAAALIAGLLGTGMAFSPGFLPAGEEGAAISSREWSRMKRQWTKQPEKWAICKQAADVADESQLAGRKTLIASCMSG